MGVCLKIIGGLFKISFETRNRGNLFVLYRVRLILDRVRLILNVRTFNIKQTFFFVKTGPYIGFFIQNYFLKKLFKKFDKFQSSGI